MSRSLCDKKNPRKQETLAATKWGHVFPKRPWTLVGIYDQQLHQTINFKFDGLWLTRLGFLKRDESKCMSSPQTFKKSSFQWLLLNDSSRGTSTCLASTNSNRTWWCGSPNFPTAHPEASPTAAKALSTVMFFCVSWASMWPPWLSSYSRKKGVSHLHLALFGKDKSMVLQQ